MPTLSFSSSLLAMLKNVSFTDAVPVLDALHEKGLLDFSFPVELSYRNTGPLLLAWLVPAIEKSMAFTPQSREQLECVSKWCGDSQWLGWTGDGDKKKSLFDSWMESRSKREGFYPATKDILEYASLDLLLNWAPTIQGYRPQQVGSPGYHLLTSVLEYQDTLHLDDDGQTRGCDFIPMLVERGLKITGERNGQPVAKSFTLPNHWDLFLAAGGSPVQPVSGMQENTVQPLWEYLVQKNRDKPLGIHVAQSMKNSSPEFRAEVEREAMARYWSDAMRHGQSGHIRTRKDWATLHNEKGQNVLMLLLQNERYTEFKEFSTPKMAKPMLLEADDQGRGIWYYLLRNKKNPGQNLQRIASNAGAKPELDSMGRGFLMQGGLERSHPTGEAEMVPSLPGILTDFDVTSSVEPLLLGSAALWLSGPEEDQAKWQEYMINERSLGTKFRNFSSFNEGLSKLAQAWPDDIGPRWRAVMCINELCCPNTNWSWLDEQINKGVQFALTPEREASLDILLGGPHSTENSGGQAWALLRKMKTAALNQTAASLPKETDRRRMRP